MGLLSFVSDLFRSSNKPKAIEGVKLTSRQLKEIVTKELKQKFYVPFMVPDRTYNLADKQWLLYPYYNYYLKVLDKKKVKGWRKKFDCDNFSGVYKEELQILHHNTGAVGESIAVGIIWYTKDSGGRHAINIAVVENLEVIFIEPQTGVELCLSNKEKESCTFIYF